MKPTCVEMLRHHAYRNPNEEIRKTCQEMLDAISDPQPAHVSQSILITPEQREVYLAGIARRLDSVPDTDDADLDSVPATDDADAAKVNNVIYIFGAIVVVVGCAAFFLVR